jgi:dihydrofolate reductase
MTFPPGVLDHTLLEHRLVDEYHFWMFPTVAGGGERLFDGIDLTDLELLDTNVFGSGIVVLVYGPK